MYAAAIKKLRKSPIWFYAISVYGSDIFSVSFVNENQLNSS